MVQSLTTKNAEETPFSKCYVGDAVRVVENAEAYKNGDEGVLVSVEQAEKKARRTGRGNGSKRSWADDRVGSVKLRDGSIVRVADKHIVPAYATTVHKVQGSEYDTVVLALFQGTHWKLKTREMIYTSVTRAKKKLRIVGNTPMLDECTPLERRTLIEFV